MVCEAFHLSVSQALRELAISDLAEFDAGFLAEESALLMFEIMDYRVFASAARQYSSATPEEQQKLVKDPIYALVQELHFEQQGEKVKQRRAQRGQRG